MFVEPAAGVVEDQFEHDRQAFHVENTAAAFSAQADMGADFVKPFAALHGDRHPASVEGHEQPYAYLSDQHRLRVLRIMPRWLPY